MVIATWQGPLLYLFSPKPFLILLFLFTTPPPVPALPLNAGVPGRAELGALFRYPPFCAFPPQW